MGFRDRIRRLEQGATDAPCPQCNGFIITEEIAEDGTSSYPHGEPCPVCDSSGFGGNIGRIVVDMRGPGGASGDVYEIEYEIGPASY